MTQSPNGPVVHGQPTPQQVAQGYWGPDGYHYPATGDPHWSAADRQNYYAATMSGNPNAAQTANTQGWNDYNSTNHGGGGGGGAPAGPAGTNYAYNRATNTYSYYDPGTKTWTDNIAAGDLYNHLSEQVKNTMPKWMWDQQYGKDSQGGADYDGSTGMWNYNQGGQWKSGNTQDYYNTLTPDQQSQHSQDWYNQQASTQQNSYDQYQHRNDKLNADPTGKYFDVYDTGQGKWNRINNDANTWNNLNPYLQKQYSAGQLSQMGQQANYYHTREGDYLAGESQRFGSMGNNQYHYSSFGV